MENGTSCWSASAACRKSPAAVERSSMGAGAWFQAGGLAARAAAVVAVACAAAVAAPADARQPARATADRPDVAGKYQVHVVYFLPSDAPDRRLDLDPTTHNAINAANTWLAGQAAGLRWRFDTHAGGLDITFVRAPQVSGFYGGSGSPSLTRIREELARRGLDQAKTSKRYLVLYGGDLSASGFCGIADYPIYGASVYTGQDKGARLGGETAVVAVGPAADGCRAGDYGSAGSPGFFQGVLLHELMHLEGLVAPAAPHTCRESAAGALGQHVCTLGAASVQHPVLAEADPESFDLMFPGAVRPLAQLRLDLGHDDYYAAPAALLRLEQSVFLTGPGAAQAPAGGPVPAPAKQVHVDLPGVPAHNH